MTEWIALLQTAGGNDHEKSKILKHFLMFQTCKQKEYKHSKQR